jgi:hypothetical protein
MKKCPYCGKEYPDDTVVCPADQNTLVVAEVVPLTPDYPKQHTIIIRRFTVGSLLKIVAIGCIISLFGFSMLMGFFSLFGAHTVHWNRESLTGTAGLTMSVILGGILAIAFTIIGWIGFAISFWLFSKFSSLKLHYIADKKMGQTNEMDVRT